MITLQHILLETTTKPECYPYRSDEEWAIADAITNEPGLASGLPVEQVSLDRLVTTQSMTGAGIPPTKPIIVLNNGTNMLVIDGHHRMKGAEQHGDATISVRIIHAKKALTVKSAAELLGIDRSRLLSAMHPEDRNKYE